jgi:acyl-CoA reductase-like NAD-dependent aldehyde dehydrogenase
MSNIQRTYSPIDGSLCAERFYASRKEAEKALHRAKEAQREWRRVPLADRISVCRRFAAAMLAKKEDLGRELTVQMGRPIRYTPNEIVGMAGRATAMCDLATDALAEIELGPKEGFRRFIRREPHGVVFTIAPWNYPYLTAVNTVIPALISGNSVILKHSPQTPLCAERMAEGLREAGLPHGVFQYLHLSDHEAEWVVGEKLVDYIAFTGSVATGLAVQGEALKRVCGVGLELGGKDPAYVRADADLDYAIENVVDGAFFSSGQSCCAVERVYVHSDVYDRFVEGAVELTRKYVLGDPLQPATTLGPMVRTSSADFVRVQIQEAVDQGARPLIDETEFPASKPGTPYLAPQILVDVDHTMRVMREESFGPVVGIMKVRSDDEAVKLMNDSPFGLTASVWTADEAAALAIGDEIECGTLFMNRCDYLDPELAWVGVKDSGRGCTLSKIGYEHLTRPKSYHLKVRTD